LLLVHVVTHDLIFDLLDIVLLSSRV